MNNAALLVARVTFLSCVFFISVKAQHPQASWQIVARLKHQYDSIHRADSIAWAELLQNTNGAELSNSNIRSRIYGHLRRQHKEDSLARIGEERLLRGLREQKEGAPVVLFRDTLFYIYTRVGSFSPSKRAEAISRRILVLSENSQYHQDSLKLVESDRATDIVYTDEVIMSVNDLEALRYGTSTYDLADQYQTIISTAITKDREATSLRHIAIRIIGIVTIVVSILIIIRLIRRLFKKLRERLIRKKEKLARGVRLGNYQFLDANRLTRLVLLLTNILRFATIVSVIYITLPLMFFMFPWTEGIARTLLDWIITPLVIMSRGFVAYLPNLFAILVIILITRYVLKFLNFITSEIESGALIIPGFYADWARPTQNMVRMIVMAFSFVIVFPYLPGSDSPVFQGVSVFLGLLFSLGSSSAIANMVAGIVITYMRPFKIGDRVKIGDISGDVTAKTLLVTRIRTVKNEDITVPNSAVLSGHTINYTTAASEAGLILHTSVTIGYGIPWRQVHELLVAAAQTTPLIVRDDERSPFVLQTGLHDFYVEYQLNAYTEHPNQIQRTYSHLHQNIQDKFAEAGVEIMSPHFRAIRERNDPELPKNKISCDINGGDKSIITKQKADEQASITKDG